jgi:hypothetical protein
MELVMGDFDAEELAQLGLKQIEDAIVGLLARHEEGLTAASIAERLGLTQGLAIGKRTMIAEAVLGLLLETGRILWDTSDRVYRDNPDKI